MTTVDVIQIFKSMKNRPSWEEYFMMMSYLSTTRSTCDRLHVGCVIVKDNIVLSTGYNGFIAGAPHVGYVRDGHEQLTIHAETNAVCHGAKEGGRGLKGSTAYVTHYCCINCAKLLISSGIKEIIYAEDYKNDELVKSLCEMAGVKIRKFNPYNENAYV